MFYVVRNTKLDNGEIEGEHYCDFQYACKGNPSLNFIYIKAGGIYYNNEFTICKSCLNFLVNEIDKSILSDIKKET